MNWENKRRGAKNRNHGDWGGGPWRPLDPTINEFVRPLDISCFGEDARLPHWGSPSHPGDQKGPRKEFKKKSTRDTWMITVQGPR
jgi:hypothetical protein